MSIAVQYEKAPAMSLTESLALSVSKTKAGMVAK